MTKTRFHDLGIFLACLCPLTAAEYELTPKRVERGGSYTLKINVAACDATNKLPADAYLETVTSGLEITEALVADASQCEMTAKLAVRDRATFGKAIVSLLTGKDATKKLLKGLELDVEALSPEPTPPGLGQKVDIMWKILPRLQVSDSYGKKVADQYFAVELMVGNNSGYGLLIESIGFLAKGKTAAATPWPNDAYSITRSTIEREQQVGTRAIVLNSITGAAGLAAGMSGFFVREDHLAQFGVFLGLTNPLLEGFRLVWPDKTVRHLVALDTRIFRGSMIVKHNESKSIFTFISREMVECRRHCDTMQGGRLKFAGKAFNPVQIMEELGQVVLVGHEIDYINRVRVVSREVPAAAAVPPVAFELPAAARTITQDGILKLRLNGNGLANITPSVPDDSGLRATRSTNDPNGKFSEVTVEALLDAAPGRVPMPISTAGGATIVNLFVTAGTPKVTGVEPKNAPIGSPATITLTGEFLNRAKAVAPTGVTVAVQPATDEDQKMGKKLILQVTPATGMAAGATSIGLTRDGKSTTFPINIVP